jgi:hypothetical protein
MVEIENVETIEPLTSRNVRSMRSARALPLLRKKLATMKAKALQHEGPRDRDGRWSTSTKKEASEI